MRGHVHCPQPAVIAARVSDGERERPVQANRDHTCVWGALVRHFRIGIGQSRTTVTGSVIGWTRCPEGQFGVAGGVVGEVAGDFDITVTGVGGLAVDVEHRLVVLLLPGGRIAHYESERCRVNGC